MGRARIKAILAAWKPLLAGLLSLLILGGAAAPASATEPPEAPPRSLAAAGLAWQPTAAAETPCSPSRPGGAAQLQLASPGIHSADGWRPAAAEQRSSNGGSEGEACPAAADRSEASAPPQAGEPGATATRRPQQLPTQPVHAGWPAAVPTTVASHPWGAKETGSRQPLTRLERRLQQWPAWRLPAPLARPGRLAPPWPAWFRGDWMVESTALPAEPGESEQPAAPWCARFLADGQGGAVADRAGNALAVGRSLLGERLLSVQDDPANPQRQLARLAGDQLLETTLIGQRGERPQPDRFLNDELSLQVLHRPGEPRLSRIETLGSWRLQSDGSIAGEQWQARYGSPADGLAAAALSSEHWRFRLVPVPPESDRARGTAVPAVDCR